MKPLTGFRVDAARAVRKIDNLRKFRASNMKKDLMEFVRKSLTTAAQITPVRNAQIIRDNQTKQYAHRIDYIPSFHTLENPSLIVNEIGEHWIYCDGKWYRGDWRLPDHVYSAYEDLLAERERRMATNRQEFINSRSQARWLYKQSWKEVAESLGLQISAAIPVEAQSRHNPPKQPPKGYAQIRGGKEVLSVDIRNPFLEQPSRYKSFSGRVILQEAMSRHRAQFVKASEKTMKQRIKKAAA